MYVEFKFGFLLFDDEIEAVARRVGTICQPAMAAPNAAERSLPLQ